MHFPPLQYPGLVLHHGTASEIAAAQAVGAPTAGSQGGQAQGRAQENSAQTQPAEGGNDTPA